MDEQARAEVQQFLRDAIDAANRARARPDAVGQWMPAIQNLEIRLLHTLQPRWCGLVAPRLLIIDKHGAPPGGWPAGALVAATYLEAPTAFPAVQSGPANQLAGLYDGLWGVLHRISKMQRQPGDDGDAILWYVDRIGQVLGTAPSTQPGQSATEAGVTSPSPNVPHVAGRGLSATVERASTMWDRLECCQDGGKLSLFAAEQLFGELISILRAVLDSLPNDPTHPIGSEVEQICDALKAAPLDEVAWCFAMLGQSSTPYTVFVHNPTRATAADAFAACTDVFWLINRLYHTNPASPTADDKSPIAKSERAAHGPEQQTPSDASGDNLEYKPVHWFPQALADRLRQAARKMRKGKRVRSKRWDGVVLYCVADAKRWWPKEFENRQHDGA